MRILLTGPIGSGKTTQAEKLAHDLNFYMVNTGGLIREEVAKNSPLSQKLKSALETGEMAPDDLVSQIVQNDLKNSTKDVVFDSYPRRLSQLAVFDPNIDLAIYLDISDAELEQRLLKRGRADDKKEIIENRLKVYHTETKPILEYFQKQNKLLTIDGHGSIEKVHQKIKQALGIM